MRKISKISLVAAVAVAGFSTANAQPLEEAIKNVDVSGSVVYRYDNFGQNEVKGNPRGNDANRSGNNQYKVGLNLSSKVNDYVKFNSRFLVADEGNGGFVSLKSGRSGGNGNVAGDNNNAAGSDTNAGVELSNAYFGLTVIPNTVINIGKQGLTTPYTVAVDINGNEQTGTGILALTNVGPVTFGAGYFNNTNLDKSFELNAQKKYGYGTDWPTGAYGFLDGGSDLYVATVQGDLDFVKLEAWYAGLQETFNTYTLAATSTLDLAENAKIGLEARYVNLTLNREASKELTYSRTTGNNAATDGKSGEKDNSMFRFAVDGKFSIVNARLAYTKTGKEGGLTALDQDAKNTSLGWAITSNGVANADYYQAALGADILDNLNFTLHYGNLKAGNTKNYTVAGLNSYKAEEIFGQLTYKMSKNLSTYLRYGTYESKDAKGKKDFDQNRGRLQVAYTF